MRQRRTPPLRNCIGCRGNPRRTWQRHYLCHACTPANLFLVVGATDVADAGERRNISQLRELPGETFEDMFGGAA